MFLCNFSFYSFIFLVGWVWRVAIRYNKSGGGGGKCSEADSPHAAAGRWVFLGVGLSRGEKACRSAKN